MAVELLGGRLLAPTFGSSIYVWGAIITVFMLALSLGYLGGRTLFDAHAERATARGDPDSRRADGRAAAVVR